MCAKQFDHSNKEFKLVNPDKLKIACVVSEWHNEITEKLFICLLYTSDAADE